jgi:hypothetical protein
MIIRSDPEAEREAIEWIIHDILHGEHDEEEVRLADEVKRLSMPKLPEGWDDDAAA